MMDGRLVGAARLQVVMPDQFHVGGFGRRPDHLLLRVRTAGAQDERTENENWQFDATGHAFVHGAVTGQSLLADLSVDIRAVRIRIALRLINRR
jgi:hypothetical protein